MITNAGRTAGDGVWAPPGERNFRLLAAGRIVDYVDNGVAPIAPA